MDEKMNAEKLVKQWADDESFHDFAESHGAVLRNFARWMSRREPAQSAKYRACVEALREAKETIEYVSQYVTGMGLSAEDDYVDTVEKIDAALAGLEG